MSFVKHVSITFVTRIGLIFFSLISSIITAHSLGPVGKGTFAALGIITGLASQFGMIGFNSANTHFSSQSPTNRPQIISNSIWIAAINGFFCMFVAALLTIFYPHIIAPNTDTILVWMTIITLPFVILATLLQNELIGEGSILAYNGILLVSQIATATMTAIVLLVGKGTILHLVIGTGIIITLSTFAYIFACFKGKKIQLSFDFKLAKTMLHYGVKLYAAQFFYFLVMRSDLYFVNTVGGPYQTGLYATASQFADLVLLIPASIGLVLFPRVSADPVHRLEFAQKTIRVTTFITIAIILIGIPLFTPLVRVLFGEAFVPAVHSMNLLWPGIFFMSGVTIITNYIASHQLTWKYPLIWMIGAIINVGLNIIFIPRFGAPAAAAISSFSYGIIFICFVSAFRRMTGSSLGDIFIVKKSELMYIWQQLLPRRS